MDNNTKHSARVDDELHHETRSIEQGAPIEAHTREDLHHEDLPPDAANRPARPGERGGADVDIDRRAALASVLRPSAFPGARDRLLEAAVDEHAPPHVLEELRRLPDGVRFEHFEDVWEALGGRTERGHTTAP